MSEIPQEASTDSRERSLVSASEMSWALRAVNRLSADIDVELARRLHLRLLDTMALGHVMTAESPLGPAELSARLGISTGSGTELVDRLESAGHVRRRRDSRDRRRVALSASPEAVRSLLDELAPLFTTLDELADEFTPSEQAAVIRYLSGAAVRMTQFIENGTET